MLVTSNIYLKKSCVIHIVRGVGFNVYKALFLLFDVGVVKNRAFFRR